MASATTRQCRDGGGETCDVPVRHLHDPVTTADNAHPQRAVRAMVLVVHNSAVQVEQSPADDTAKA
jgi:hypothetical protein